MLVKNVGIRSKHKIGDRWEHDPYVVIDQTNDDIPVYDVWRQNTRSRKTRLLNRILLLPFMGLPGVDEEEEKIFGPDPAEDRIRDPPYKHTALYRVAIKAGLYRKAVQVCYIPIPYDIKRVPF